MNITRLVDESVVVVLYLENEPVLGKFVKEKHGEYTGIAFKSIICPRFIKRGKDAGVTGFYCEISDIKTRYNDVFISFDHGEKFTAVIIPTFYGEFIINCD